MSSMTLEDGLHEAREELELSRALQQRRARQTEAAEEEVARLSRRLAEQSREAEDLREKISQHAQSLRRQAAQADLQSGAWRPTSYHGPRGPPLGPSVFYFVQLLKNRIHLWLKDIHSFVRSLIPCIIGSFHHSFARVCVHVCVFVGLACLVASGAGSDGQRAVVYAHGRTDAE